MGKEKKYYAHDWKSGPRRPYKPRDAAKTARMMAAVRSKHSEAELILRRALWHRGWRYRLHANMVTGRPDLVFPKLHVAVFVDSDFWHGRALREAGPQGLGNVVRGKNQSWWREKLQRNINRDDYVTSTLQSQGWKVIRVWESDIRTDIQGVVDAVVGELMEARSNLT